MTIKFFKSAPAFRRWLEANHARATELRVGFYKVDSRRGGLTYAEALDEALCFGWIDGVRKRVDAVAYGIRFTPRKPKSIWSRVNLRHVQRLKTAGRMTPAGLKVFVERDPARSGIYAFENAPRKLAAPDEKQFKADKKAWKFFQRQAPGCQRTAIWWVVNAKKDETRGRRLARLIADSTSGQRLAHLTHPK